MFSFKNEESRLPVAAVAVADIQTRLCVCVCVEQITKYLCVELLIWKFNQFNNKMKWNKMELNEANDWFDYDDYWKLYCWKLKKKSVSRFWNQKISKTHKKNITSIKWTKLYVQWSCYKWGLHTDLYVQFNKGVFIQIWSCFELSQFFL